MLGHDANYIEERILKPLQAAVALVREGAALEVTIRQRTEQVQTCERELQTLAQKKQQLLDGIEAAKKLALDTRMDVQAQSREDRKKRDEEALQWESAREGLRVAHQHEKEALAKVMAQREQEEKKLDDIRADIVKRLQAIGR